MHSRFSFRTSFRKFISNTRGTILLPAAVGFLAMIMAAGAALDYTRISHTKNIIANALDAALLASAKNLSAGATSDAQFRLDFENFFQANIGIRSKQTDAFTVTQFTANAATGEVTATVQADLKMAFMGVFGRNNVLIDLNSAARYRVDSIELAMMLDVTTSMKTSGKLASLQAAAKSAIDILLPAGGTPNGKIKIGLVPYSYAVNAGVYASPVAVSSPTYGGTYGYGGWTSHPNGNLTNCVIERTGAEAYTDVYPSSNDETTKIGRDTRAACPYVAIRPLTTVRDDLIGDINNLVADGATAGHLGIAWSYYMLSEKWKALWPEASKPKNYSTDVQKIALLMTDGIFNTFYEKTYQQTYSFNSYSWQVKGSEDTAKGLCADMKADKNGKPGIIIYSIAFLAPTSAQQTLKACATPDTASTTYYYTASNDAELTRAFNEIALNIQQLRLTQ